MRVLSEWKCQFEVFFVIGAQEIPQGTSRAVLFYINEPDAYQYFRWIYLDDPDFKRM
jgi:hypothetical protein